jgi:hypothetical protein
MIEVNGKKYVKINGFHIKGRRTATAVMVNCDGDIEWLPISTTIDNHDGTVLIAEWIYKQKFPNG